MKKLMHILSISRQGGMKKILSYLSFTFAICCLFSVSGNSQAVGIGTSTPDLKLHVAEDVSVGDGVSGTFLNIHNSTLSSPIGTMSGIRFRLDGVNTGANSRYKGGIFFQKTALFAVGSLIFATNSASDNSNVTAANARMVINSAGNVGIGTTSPQYKLDVDGGDLFINTGSGSLKIGFPGADDKWNFATLGGGQDLLMRSETALGAVTTRVIFKQDGRVGIGTTAPATGYLVSIAGKAICTELRVQAVASWPDYVFKKNYRLLTIPELEKYISLYQHLPGIPEAPKIEKEGIDVGDMQKKMMEKIEELSLYIIQLHKQNEQLAMELKLLKEQVVLKTK